MNAYLQWNYCKKVDNSPNFCTFRTNTNYKKNTHPRKDQLNKHSLDKFNP